MTHNVGQKERVKPFATILAICFATSLRAQEPSTNYCSVPYAGVGIVVCKFDQLTVAAVMKDSPAKAAGITPGDAILEIDGYSAAGMTVQAATQAIRGIPGSTVTIKLVKSSDGSTNSCVVTRQAFGQVSKAAWESGIIESSPTFSVTPSK